MITFFNKFRIGLLSMYVLLGILISSVSSCSKDELEIQNDFPFEVKVMPIPKEIANGNTVEIRLTIQPTGNYNNTQYYLRYFQFDGQGTLQYNDTSPYLPNDSYPLQAKQFRLYYTSNSTVSQSFDVWISDNFGNERQLSFEFNSSN